jgi:hypothetical protein
MSVSYTNLISDADKVKIGEFHTPHDDYPVYDKHSDELIVTPTLTSGIEIGKINDISLFAPTQDEILIEQELTSGTEVGTVNDIPLYVPNFSTFEQTRVYKASNTSIPSTITPSVQKVFDWLLIYYMTRSTATYGYLTSFIINAEACNITYGNDFRGNFTLPDYNMTAYSSNPNLSVRVVKTSDGKFKQLSQIANNSNMLYIDRIYTIKF